MIKGIVFLHSDYFVNKKRRDNFANKLKKEGHIVQTYKILFRYWLEWV